MSSEVAKPDIVAVSPLTGEVVPRDAPTDVLAERLREMQNFETNGVRPFKDAIRTELLARGDAEATWTVRAGAWLVEMDGPGRTVFPDAEGLYLALTQVVVEQLEQDGGLSVAAVEKAVEPVTEYKVHRAGINALRKLGGRVAAVLDEFEQESPKPRQVRVREAGR